MTGDDQLTPAMRCLIHDEVDRYLLETLSEETKNLLNETLSKTLGRLAELEKSISKSTPEPPTAPGRRLKAVKDEEPSV